MFVAPKVGHCVACCHALLSDVATANARFSTTAYHPKSGGFGLDKWGAPQTTVTFVRLTIEAHERRGVLISGLYE